MFTNVFPSIRWVALSVYTVLFAGLLSAQSTLPNLQFAQQQLNVTIKAGDAPGGVSVSLNASDGGAPIVTFDEDSDASDWLLLPADQSSATIEFKFVANLPIGRYNTTIIASADGYEPAALPVSLTVRGQNAPDVAHVEVTESQKPAPTAKSLNTAFFTNVVPNDGGTGVSPVDFQVSVEVVTPMGFTLDQTTLGGSVKLFERRMDGSLVEVPSNSNDTGGNDAITLTPTVSLKYLTTYQFRVDGVEAFNLNNPADRMAFEVFTSTFTTDSQDDTNSPRDLAGVSFTQVKGSALGNGVGERFSSLVIGPDGKLYASTTGEVIKRWDIAPNGTLTNLQELTFNLTGARDPITNRELPDDRLIIGLAFDPASTADNLIAYVTHSARVLSSGPSWDGKLTRLSGPDLGQVDDVIQHLPRSVKDHLPNSIVFGPDGAMYLVVGSNTAGGDPDVNWNFRPERLLAAAVLRVDMNKLALQTLPYSVYTTSDITVINDAPAVSATMSDGTYNPYGSESPVTLYATGMRNAYDMVFHSNGWLYIPTNGTAGNGETSPNAPASASYIEPGIGIRRPDGTFFTDLTIPPLRGGETQKDWLFKTKGGSYHGHPNPYRGEFVLNHGGRPYTGLPGQAEGFYTDVEKYPDNLAPDPNYVEVAYDFGRNRSPNGIIEYRSNAFNGRLRGMLMVARFSGQDDVLAMEPGNTSGDVLITFPDIPGLQGLDDPLDVIEDPRTGNMYVSEYDRDGETSSFGLTLLRADVPATLEAEITALPEELIFEATRNREGARTQTKSFTIRNPGNDDLVINDVAFTGRYGKNFVLTGPRSVTIPPSGSQDYTVTFAPARTEPRVYQESSILFQTNAPSQPEYSVGLHALYKRGHNVREEPPLQRIVDVLGIGINVGTNRLEIPGTTTLIGDEIALPLFEAAGPGPVTMEPVGRYSATEAADFGWYTNLGGTVTRNQVGTLSGARSQSQTLYPSLIDGGTSFNSQGAFFGFFVEPHLSSRILYTEDELNDDIGGLSKHRTRVYPAKDRDGAIIPDSYVVVMEGNGLIDYQDHIFVISNVRPFGARVLKMLFLPQEVSATATPGDVSPPFTATLAANAGLVASAVTLRANESWVVLPTTPKVGSPMRFFVNGFALTEGAYEATVTAEAPGFAPAELRIKVNVQSSTNFFARINFQDDSFDPPLDYYADTGEAYGNRGNGLSYGWIDPLTRLPSDNTARARGENRGASNRSSDFDKIFRSYNMLDLIGKNVPHDWELDVPNGTYLVEVAAGDPVFYDSEHVLRAEGVTLVNRFVPNALNYYQIGSGVVEVRDGKLTIDDLGARANGNSKILYLSVSPVNRRDRPSVVATIGGRQNQSGDYYEAVTVSLTATDDARSGGISSISYRLNDGRFLAYTGPFQVLLGEGLNSEEFRLDVEAIDNNGSTGTLGQSFKLIRSTGAIARVENMTKIPGTDRSFPAPDFFTFNRLENNVNVLGQAVTMHDENVMRIHNDGPNPLLISQLTTSDTTDFIVTGLDVPPEGITVAPGGFVEATLRFIHSGSLPKRVITGKLILVSNAENADDVDVTMRGAYSDIPEGDNEISAQQMFRAFGWRTEMGRNDVGNFITRPSADYPTDQQVDAGMEGDMILSQFFVAADPDQPVTMLQLTALHGPEGAGTSLRDRNGRSLGFSYRHGPIHHQSFFPGSSDETEDFAFNSAIVTEPFQVSIANYRTIGGNASQQLRNEILGIRIYRVIDGNGDVVPNEYIINQDYILNGCGAGSSNCDWNDNTSYIINARPLAVPKAIGIDDFTISPLVQSFYDIVGSFDKGFPGNRLTYTASLADGNAVPTWIGLDELTGTFVINAPLGASGTSYDITVTARDYNGMTVDATFTLNVSGEGFDCTVDANVGGEVKTLTCASPEVRLSGFTTTGVYQWTGPDGFVSSSTEPLVSVAGTYTLRTVSNDPLSPCPLTDVVIVTEDEVFASGGCGTGGTGSEEFWLEAECADVGSSFLTDGLLGASNGDVVFCSNGTSLAAPPEDIPANRIRFTLEDAIEGSYNLFARVRGDFSKYDSYWVRVNDGEWILWFWRVDDTSGLVWDEVLGGPFNLAAGTNTVDFAFRERNVWLDKIHLNTTGARPADIGEVNSCPGTNLPTSLWLEAECAVVGDNFVTGFLDEASNGSVVSVPSIAHVAPPADVPANRVRFEVSGVRPGNYNLFARVRGDFTLHDSYWVRVNGGEWILWFWRTDDVSGLVWDEVFDGPFAMTSGTNTIDFAFREINVWLDKIHLNQTGVRPSGIGLADENCTGGLNRPPVAKATFAPQGSTLPLAVQLDGSLSNDPDGAIVSYAWTVDGGNPIDGAATGITLGPGTHEVQLTVTDDEGATGVDLLSIFVDEDGSTGEREFWLEAECADVGDNFFTEGQTGISNGRVVHVANMSSFGVPPPNEAANRVRFTVADAAPGEFHLFARIRGDQSDKNSYWVRVNGGEWILWSWELSDPSGMVWDEVPNGPFTMTQGVNTIDFAFRERQTFLDKIHLNRTGVVPTGLGDEASNCTDLNSEVSTKPTGLGALAKTKSAVDNEATVSPELLDRLVAYPNPVREELQFALEGDYEGAVSAYVVSTSGQTVKAVEMDKTAYRLIGSIGADRLSAGTYVLRVVAGTELRQTTFVKIR